MPAYQGDKAGTGPTPKLPNPVVPQQPTGGAVGGGASAAVGTLPNPSAAVGTLPNPTAGRMSASNSVSASPAIGGQAMAGSVPQVMSGVGNS
jgi:hypothetical protein